MAVNPPLLCRLLSLLHIHKTKVLHKGPIVVHEKSGRLFPGVNVLVPTENR